MTQYPPPPPSSYGQPPQNHPQAVTVLVLGILGLVLCQVLAPIAWVMGGRAQREIDGSPGRYGGRDLVVIGRVLGIIGTVILVLAFLVVVGVFVLGGVLSVTSTSP